MLAGFESVKSLFDASTFAPVGFGKPLNELLAAHPQGKQWQRRLGMSVWEVVRDAFEDDRSRAFLLAVGHLGAVPPDFPATGRGAYTLAGQQRGGRPIPKERSGELQKALARLIDAHGGGIIPSECVKQRVLDDPDRAGVGCSDGSA